MDNENELPPIDWQAVFARMPPRQTTTAVQIDKSCPECGATDQTRRQFSHWDCGSVVLASGRFHRTEMCRQNAKELAHVD